MNTWGNSWNKNKLNKNNYHIYVPIKLYNRTAGVGATCALSLLPIRIGSFELKPIMYYLAKDLVPLKPVYTIINKKLPHEGGADYEKEENQENKEEDDEKQKSNNPIDSKEEEEEEGEEVIIQPRILFYWQNSRYCRMHIRLLTAIDIILLELEFGLKLYYIFSFDIDTVVIASSITWGIIGALISVFTICYSVGILKRLKQNEAKMLTTAGVLTASTNVTTTTL
ncbi:hypothetical protein INT45_008835 [Circinella minor]|uniref:Uncharacterized protein n=1 Tax=Circinella minor TaxID=1195481 RepID=A0A8H7VI92_9FUNG|nr:hypothetical protein INT45_008835 [Circinella minor]